MEKQGAAPVAMEDIPHPDEGNETNKENETDKMNENEEAAGLNEVVKCFFSHFYRMLNEDCLSCWTNCRKLQGNLGRLSK